jgi:hypothetical protein
MMYDLDTPIRFGRHRGRLVEEVLEDDPGYLLWCMENVESFDVDQALHDEIVRAARSRP